MKIRMLTSIGGSGFTLAPGDETELFTDAESVRLIEAGYAVPVAETRIETTAKPAARERRG